MPAAIVNVPTAFPLIGREGSASVPEEITRLLLTLMSVPVVTVLPLPGLIVRLLNWVKTLDGRALVAATTTVPLEGTQEYVPPLPTVIAPFNVSVPPSPYTLAADVELSDKPPQVNLPILRR